ncbi:putative 2-aminoethylphosphonate ABC transporter substrate-binding protein [Barrientosiimonas marina]|uniref:Extracellular solute-binding protein n=1 Tax=Lentibacillus kimchii TaxID=1542911 RepID=A0ABW2URP6_9BACI
MKKFLIVMAVALLALIATACGSDDADSAGDGDGDDVSGTTLKVYTHNNADTMDPLAEDIEENTGVELDVLRLSSEEGWSRIESEAPNFGADMQIGMLEGIGRKAADKDYLMPYESENWEDVPDKFKDPDGNWYGTGFWYTMVGMNKEIFEEKDLDKPESWEDLLEPQYKGEIIMPDPGTSGTAYLFVAAILQIMGEEDGWDYLKELDKNVAQYEKSGTAPGEKVAQGEYAVAITWDKGVTDFADEGYPIEGMIPSEGVGYSLDVNWIFKDTEHPEAAKKVMDYMGTKNFAEKNAEYRSVVTKPGVEGTEDSEELEKQFIDYDAKWAAENKDAIMKKWRETFSD